MNGVTVRRVLICDAHELNRFGLKAMLNGEPDLTVHAEVEKSSQLVEMAQKTRPDVAVVELDKHLRETSDTLRSLTEIAPVVALSLTWDERRAIHALRAGVHGLARKADKRHILVDAVQAAIRGERYVPPSLTAQLVERMLRRTPASVEMYQNVALLTSRERSVLMSLAVGMSTDEIAKKLSISNTTVKSHISHMLGKLRLRDRAQAVAVAYRVGLVEE